MAVDPVHEDDEDRAVSPTGLLLDSFTSTPPEALAAITMPTLVVCGEQDQDNGSAFELVAALADAELATIPGTHMSSVTEPELGEAIAAL